MRRPGPLQDLPLEFFLPPNPNLPSRPSKRAGPNLFSPAKRRILTEEGVFSPEKTLKSPVSGRDAPARFAHVLSGPASPAKKLDFGTPKHHLNPRIPAESTTPVRPKPSSSKLAPSPEFRSSFSTAGHDQEMDDYFSRPSSSSMPPPKATPTEFSCLPLPPSDPQSVHYPGFRVHFDTQPDPTPFDNEMEGLNLIDDQDKEGLKENTAPRRKARKATTAPSTDAKSLLLSPDSKKREMDRVGKTKSTPGTPKNIFGADRQDPAGSPTPRRTIKKETASMRLLRDEECGLAF